MEAMTDTPLTAEQLFDFERRCKIGTDGHCVGPTIFALIATVRAAWTERDNFGAQAADWGRIANDEGRRADALKAERDRLKAWISQAVLALNDNLAAHDDGMAHIKPAWIKHFAEAALDPQGTDMDIQARHAVAQGWCEPETRNYEMDAVLAEAIARPVGRALRAWYDTAAQHARNEEYYRGLVQEIGEMLGEQAYVSDDGSKQEDVLCAKVPELVRAALKPQDTGNGNND